MTTPADEIRTAASKLRALATAASTDTDGTPTANWNTKPRQSAEFEGLLPDDGNRRLLGDYLTDDDGRRISWPSLLHGGAPGRKPRMRARHADYAAAMDPTVGQAVADWLDSEADLLTNDDFPAIHHHALAVARAINRGKP